MANARTDRQKALLDHLGEAGTGSIDDLCRHFGVSEMTIRRDLSALQREGLLIRTHGGAKLTESAFFEISFEAKATQFVKEKKRIAERAAEMVREDLEIMGPVKLSEVEAAQQSIISAARRLEDAGELAIGGKGGGDEYV
ncbi:MAG: DeoR family transcriptional regulator [Myxococcales bacterium]|nr:DeoR family transcriptional regulator [Myxococcales bacterium]